MKIVKNFKTPSKEFVETPDEVIDAFHKEKTSLAEVKDRSEDPEALMFELQKFLLLSLNDEGLVGIYSTMHVRILQLLIGSDCYNISRTLVGDGHI